LRCTSPIAAVRRERRREHRIRKAQILDLNRRAGCWTLVSLLQLMV
jgi:hypothetical protein